MAFTCAAALFGNDFWYKTAFSARYADVRKSWPPRHNSVVKSARKDALMPLYQSRNSLVRRSFLLAPLAWALPARAQQAIPPSLLEHGSKLLATLIQTARESAIANGVKSMPPRIHSALLGFFPDAILRKVRYTSGHADAISI